MLDLVGLGGLLTMVGEDPEIGIPSGPDHDEEAAREQTRLRTFELADEDKYDEENMDIRRRLAEGMPAESPESPRIDDGTDILEKTHSKGSCLPDDSILDVKDKLQLYFKNSVIQAKMKSYEQEEH